MGRYKAGAIITRDLGWGKIIFSDKYRITVETPSITVVFHRYGAPRGYYGESWKQFRQECARRKFDDIYEIFRYAERFDVEYSTTVNKPKIERRKNGPSTH